MQQRLEQQEEDLKITQQISELKEKTRGQQEEDSEETRRIEEQKRQHQ